MRPAGAASRKSARGAARGPAVLVGAVALGVALAGCGATVPGAAAPAGVPARDRALVLAYVASFNAAADAGPDAQSAFLRANQVPGVPLPAECQDPLSLHTRLVERTLRPDPEWTQPGRAERRPDGAVYVAASALSATREGGATVSETVGSQHFVIQNGRVYGYAPCQS